MQQSLPAGERDRLKARFEARLDDIQRAISWAGRRCCLRDQELEDFGSWVYLRLIEDDYRVLREFGGRSSLGSYLSTVVLNLARDFRARRWGRWRPSAHAERVGALAVELEILIRRDGFSEQEAVERLRTSLGSRTSIEELTRLAAELPQRNRTTIDGEVDIDATPAASRADEQLMSSETRESLLAAERALGEVLSKLQLEERLLLRMYYISGLPMRAIGEVLGRPQRQLYSRRDRCLKVVRQGLEERGLDAREVLAAAEWLRDEWEPSLKELNAGHDVRPSNQDESR